MNMEKDQIFELHVIERGEDDYEVVASLRYGGLELNFSKTIGEIRDFFTRRSETKAKLKPAKSPKRKKGGLKSVK